MNFSMIWKRARRGFRDDYRLHIVALTSLTLAFGCMIAALVGLSNLARVADKWSGQGRVTVYLRDAAPESDVARLKDALAQLPEVESVNELSSEQAKQEFVDSSDLSADLGALPPEAFPASIEIRLKPGIQASAVASIASRLSDFRAVQDVETYRGWFEQLAGVVSAGRAISFGIAILVLFCVIAVVGNTIRLAIAGRKSEIEVMKLCGATDGFVRNPFLLEGALQGAAAAGLALLLLWGGYALFKTDVNAMFGTVFGTHAVFLHPLVALAVLVGGGLVGLMGSALALRRHMVV